MDPLQIRKGGANRRRLSVAAAYLALLIWGAWVAAGVLPSHVVVQGAPTQVSASARVLFPQGWSFFTRDPTGPFFYGDVADGTFTIAQDGVSESLRRGGGRSHLGWDRAPRVNQEWMANVAKLIGTEDWAACGNSLEECFAQSRQGGTVTVVQAPTLGNIYCGTMVMVRHTPTPWAWAKIAADTLRLEAARVEVSCDAR